METSDEDRTEDRAEDKEQEADGVRIGYQRRVIFPKEETEMRRTTKRGGLFYTAITSDSCHLLLPPY